MTRSLLDPTLVRSRWAAIGAAVAVVLGAGGLAVAHAATPADVPANFHALTPVRVFDTRDGTGGVPIGPIAAGASLDVQVAGTNGVPTDATAVGLNVTVVNGSTSSYLTVWPTGQTRPLASSVNWTNGDATPNGVTVSLGAGGKLSFFNFAGTVHVLADVAGYYTSALVPPFTNVVAQSTVAVDLPVTTGLVAVVSLTLPDACPGVDHWKVLVQTDGYFLTGVGPNGIGTTGLSLDGSTYLSGAVVNQNLAGAGQLREAYSVSYLFDVDAGTRVFYQLGANTTGVSVAPAQNNLIAQSVAVGC